MGNLVHSKSYAVSVTPIDNVVLYYFTKRSIIPVTTKAGRGKTAILYPFEIIASSSEGSDNSSPEIPEN